MKRNTNWIAALVVGGTLAVSTLNAAIAGPVTSPLGSSYVASTDASAVENVQWRRGGGWRGGRGWGGGIGLGILGGAVLGGALAAPYYYDRPYYSYPAPRYYEPAPSYYSSTPRGGSDHEYCANRFRSYDPGSGTYLGYDGLRHPCP